ncbi:alpha/beta hydrolase [Streptomyces sp. H72]
MARALGDGVGVLLTAEEEGHGTYPQNRCVTEAVDTYLRTGRASRASLWRYRCSDIDLHLAWFSRLGRAGSREGEPR